MIKLKKLLDEKIITEEEFNEQKTKILNNNTKIEYSDNITEETSNKLGQKLKNTFKSFCLIIFCIFLVFIIFCVSIILDMAEKSPNNASNDSHKYVTTIWSPDEGKRNIYYDDFTLLENETIGINENGTYTITGKVKQNIEGSYESLMLSFIMYDKNHNKVRSTGGFVFSNYEGDGIWSFQVSGNDADNIVESYEMEYCYGH